jgi:hypothetical protein
MQKHVYASRDLQLLGAHMKYYGYLNYNIVLLTFANFPLDLFLYFDHYFSY